MTGLRTVNKFRHSWVSPVPQPEFFLFYHPHEKINAGTIRLLLRLEGKKTQNLSRIVSDTTIKTPEIITATGIWCVLIRSLAPINYHTGTDSSDPHNHSGLHTMVLQMRKARQIQ